MIRLRHVRVKCLGICVLFMIFGVSSMLISLPAAHAASVLATSHTNVQQMRVVQKATVQKPLIPNGTCGSVYAYANDNGGSVSITLTIDSIDSNVNYSYTDGYWYGNGPNYSGTFNGNGGSFEYMNFQADGSPLSLYGYTYWYLDDGTSCSYNWSTSA